MIGVNRSARVEFRPAASGRAALEVVNVLGRRVRGLGERELPAGVHAVTWNGRDDDGRRIQRGVYFVRLAIDGEVQARKLIRLD